MDSVYIASFLKHAKKMLVYYNYVLFFIENNFTYSDSGMNMIKVIQF